MQGSHSEAKMVKLLKIKSSFSRNFQVSNKIFKNGQFSFLALVSTKTGRQRLKVFSWKRSEEELTCCSQHPTWAFLSHSYTHSLPISPTLFPSLSPFLSLSSCVSSSLPPSLSWHVLISSTVWARTSHPNLTDLFSWATQTKRLVA